MSKQFTTHGINPVLPRLKNVGCPVQGFFCEDKWQQYEIMKKELISRNLNPETYQREIKRICDLLMV